MQLRNPHTRVQANRFGADQKQQRERRNRSADQDEDGGWRGVVINVEGQIGGIHDDDFTGSHLLVLKKTKKASKAPLQ